MFGWMKIKMVFNHLEVGLKVGTHPLDGQNNFISSVTTGFGGFYFFSDLIPGTYYIEAMLPQGLQPQRHTNPLILKIQTLK